MRDHIAERWGDELGEIDGEKGRKSNPNVAALHDMAAEGEEVNGWHEAAYKRGYKRGWNRGRARWRKNKEVK